MKKLIPILIVLLFISPVFAEETFTVRRVIDGDNLELENGQAVRLIGFDCPDILYDCDSPECVERYADGWEATKFTRELVEGKEVRLEFDVQKKDKYGRLLAYVFIEEPMPTYEPYYTDPEGYKANVRNDIYLPHFLNAVIIKYGYASPMTIPPNVKYAELFKELYQEARERKKGLWKDAIQKKEGDNCISNYECATIDCSRYDTPVKEGYQPHCVKNKCKCMCYGCK